MPALTFWPIVVVLIVGTKGHGTGVLYEHDGKPFADKASCEEALPRIAENLKEHDKDFVAFKQLAGDHVQMKFHPMCIEITPQEYIKKLEAEPEGHDI